MVETNKIRKFGSSCRRSRPEGEGGRRGECVRERRKGDAESPVLDNFSSCLFEVTPEKYGTRPWVMWGSAEEGDSPYLKELRRM